jgi:hypothetical protein
MVRRELRLLAGALALAGAAAWWWPADDDRGAAAAPSLSTAATVFVPEAAQVAAPADVTSLQAALIAAAARVCAEGCDEPPLAEPARSTVVLAQVAPLPADLDAWSLVPEPMAAASAGADELAAPRPLFNTPPVPDEHDPTPADESDPDAPPAEQAAVE